MTKPELDIFLSVFFGTLVFITLFLIWLISTIALLKLLKFVLLDWKKDLYLIGKK